MEIFIPVAEGQESPQPPKKEEQTILIPAHLIVLEDDPALLELISEILSRFVLKVSGTDNPDAIIPMIDEAAFTPDPISMILMDLGIKGKMDVLILVRTLKREYPDIKLVVCSGRIRSDEFATYLEYGFDDILPKPIHIDDIKTLLGKHFP